MCANTVGANPKVSNLSNRLACVKYEWVVIVESDIHINPTYFCTIMSLLADQRIGLVTCL
jgi:Glycosyl transferase family 21